jgi:fructose-1,6-bisphosphatase I
MTRTVSLREHLAAALADTGSARAAAAETVLALAGAALDIARLLDDGPLAGNLAEVVAEESHGDAQKFLDRHTNDVIIEALQKAPVAWLGSEEMEHPLALVADGKVVVAVDPLDGSSNIDTDAPVGTIFSILPMPATTVTDPLAAFLRQGTEQVAAGYVIYGPHVALVLTMGQGTQRFILDRARGEFVLQCERVVIPADTSEYAINASNYRHWDDPVRQYVEDCLRGEEGPRGLNFNTRWLGSMVGDAYRIMARGGIYLYPADARAGYARGRLRLLYEANPIAWLVEQAGGAATDGATRILEILPTELHERVPLVFGSRIEVERIRDVYVAARFEGENSPLFGPRSLFRGAMRQE